MLNQHILVNYEQMQTAEFFTPSLHQTKSWKDYIHQKTTQNNSAL